MWTTRLRCYGAGACLALAAAVTNCALAGNAQFSVLYDFEPAALNTYASPKGSQPDTRPVLGVGNSIYGMTYDGGVNGNGVVYRFDRASGQYSVLHTFSALDANGNNWDGAYPGVALTRGPEGVFYGMATSGGANGNGTIFSITAAGEYTVLHTFSAANADGLNIDGAYPLRTVVIGDDGDLYGTTRVGGLNSCGTSPAPNGCGVTWKIDRWGKFTVLHQFTAAEGHAASLLQSHDGWFYGCAVWPASGSGLPSGLLYRMEPSGRNFEVLYQFSQANSSDQNSDGADCYEPLVETSPGVFYGTASNAGPGASGVVFRYSLSKPGTVDVVHAFSALDANGFNTDGSDPYARLTPGPDGALYSTTSYGGSAGNGVVYRIGRGGSFELLHTFTAVNATSGANKDGQTPDFGVILDYDGCNLIGMADYGGLGSASGGPGYSGGTLYQIRLE